MAACCAAPYKHRIVAMLSTHLFAQTPLASNKVVMTEDGLDAFDPDPSAFSHA
jgi:hypothetical protein